MNIMTVRGKDYQLKLTTRTALDLEEKLGKNPINIFNVNEMPAMKDLLVVLHYSLLKFNHGMSFNDTLELYDNYIDEGHNIYDFIQLIIAVFKDSGLLGDVDVDELKNLMKRETTSL